jgi:hypothetical protein
MHTVAYSTTRMELWRMYWRAWARPKGLWRVQVFFAVLVAFFFTATAGISLSAANRFLQFFTLALTALIVMLPLWPQVRYKSAVRTLSIDPHGWHTQIGAQSGSLSWKQVKSIELFQDTVTITGTNGNAIVVPRRAFESEDDRLVFYREASAWHAAASA